LPTFDDLAVACIGDCDNDGKNEINADFVVVDEGKISCLGFSNTDEKAVDKTLNPSIFRKIFNILSIYIST